MQNRKNVILALITSFVIISVSKPAQGSWLSMIGVRPKSMCSTLFVEKLINNKKSFRYPDEVKNLKASDEHSIHDVPTYLKGKLSEEAYLGASDSDVKYIIIEGPGTEWSKYTEALDIDQSTVRQLENHTGAFNVVSALTKKNNNKLFIFTNVVGNSRFVQLTSFLKLAEVSKKRIRVVGSHKSYYDIYDSTFNSLIESDSGVAPALVIFGFANTAAEIILNEFRSKNRAAYIKQNEEYSRNKWIKQKYNEHELNPLGVQVVTLNGNKVWLIDNEYGDRAGVIMAALLKNNVKDFLIFGTAGSLNEKLEVGDIISPNMILSLGKDHTRLATGIFTDPVTYRHSHVNSPSLETRLWVKQMRDQVVDITEVELFHIIDQFKESQKKHEMEFETHLVISDVISPNSQSDYTQWSEQDRLRVREQLTEVVMKHMRKLGRFSKTISTHLGYADLEYQIEYFKPERGSVR